MSPSEPSLPGANDKQLGNIDQIRDIIFGAQLREFSSRFEKLDGVITKMQEESRAAIADLKSSVTAELKTTSDLLEKRLKTQASASHEADTSIQRQLEATDKRLSRALDGLASETASTAKALRNEATQADAKLKEELSAAKNSLSEELDARAAALEEAKVSRDEMAEYLFEIGMKLKGSSIGPELSKAAKK